MPFLLPMMLQLGFGMSAVQSGMITFASSAGSMADEDRRANRCCAAIGFRSGDDLERADRRRIFLGAVVDLPPILAGLAASTPCLLVGGFFQSLQFTAYNTIAYADIPA